VFLDELQKLVARNERQLARLQRFHRDVIRHSRQDRVQADHFPALAILQDESLAVAVCGQQLRAALAQQVDAPRRFPLHHDQRAFRVRAHVHDRAQGGSRWLGKAAEELGAADPATPAIILDRQAVRSAPSAAPQFRALPRAGDFRSFREPLNLAYGLSFFSALRFASP